MFRARPAARRKEQIGLDMADPKNLLDVDGLHSTALVGHLVFPAFQIHHGTSQRKDTSTHRVVDK